MVRIHSGAHVPLKSTIWWADKALISLLRIDTPGISENCRPISQTIFPSAALLAVLSGDKWRARAQEDLVVGCSRLIHPKYDMVNFG